MAKLIFRLTPDESVDFPLKEGVTRLGRAPGNEIVINNTWISSRHASFHRTGDVIFVQDSGSSNGTSVNGVVVKEQVLRHGDRIAFGQLEACLEAFAEQPAAPPTSSITVPGQTSGILSTVPDADLQERIKELEAIQKSLLETRTAAEKAIKEREAAEAALAATELAMLSAQKETLVCTQAAETAHSEMIAEVGRAGAARMAAMEAAACQQKEMDRLTGQIRDLQTALASQEAVAERQREAFSSELERGHDELAELQKALTQYNNESSRGRLKLEAVEAARVVSSAMLKESKSAIAAVGTSHREILATIVNDGKTLDELKSEVLTLQTAANQLRDEAGLLTTQASAIRIELASLKENLEQARRDSTAEESKLRQTAGALDTLKGRHDVLASQIIRWEEQEAAMARGAAQLKEDEASSVRLRQKTSETEAALKAARAGVDILLANEAAGAAESAALQSRLDYLRRETEVAEALNTKVADLRQQQAEAERRLEYLGDRLAGMSEAPDPNWGTVHTLARSFIKKLDLLDDLIAHLASYPESESTLGQLAIFHSGLLDILKEYSIEAYRLEPGTVIDVAARKRIQIVETLSEGGHDGTRIVRTYRPGYVCLNGDLGISTLLRKADVAVSIPLS